MPKKTRFLTSTCCLVVLVGLVSSAAAADAPSVQFSKRCLMISPNEGCAVGDVNKDGNLDIVAGPAWFAGPDFIARPLRDIEEFQDDFLHNNGDHLFDVDGDGWLDVVSNSWMTSVVHWYKNPGEAGLAKGLKWKQELLKETRGQNETTVLKDFDGDGAPEWFVNHWDKKAETVCWKFTKDADGKPTLEKKLLGDQGHGHGYAFGDINGDGREDLLLELGWYERPEGDPFATKWAFHTETALPHPSCPCVITDINDDGRNDILWGLAHDYGLFWWEQGEPKADGTTTWTEHEIDKEWSQAHSIVAADLDGDGEDEYITGKRVRGHAGNDPGGKDPECVFYYKWDKPSGKFVRHTVSDFGGGVGIGMQIRTADFNDDGRIDIAVSGKTGTWVLINEGVK